MYHEMDFFLSSDGLKIMTECWLPEQRKALVVVVHGYAEHSGRYRHVVKALTNVGYGAFTLDHRGHGQSDGLRAHFENFDQLINDLDDYVQIIRTKHKGEPLFMLGHSMGALITLAYTLKHPDSLTGIVVSAAPVNADANVSKAMVLTGNILTNIIPKMPLLKVPLDTLSRDPDVIRAFETDPLTYKGNMRVRLGTELNNTAKWVREHLSELHLPVLVLYGEADQLVNPSGSRLVYDKSASKDKKIKSYHNLRHEIMNEPERETVLKDIVAWLDKHVEPQGKPDSLPH